MAGTEIAATASGKLVPKLSAAIEGSAQSGSIYLFNAATEQSLSRL
jgi:hypothetical protein